jgi:hypothetical protein
VRLGLGLRLRLGWGLALQPSQFLLEERVVVRHALEVALQALRRPLGIVQDAGKVLVFAGQARVLVLVSVPQHD